MKRFGIVLFICLLLSILISPVFAGEVIPIPIDPMDYLAAAMLPVVFVLYIIGMMLKRLAWPKDKYIPLFLMGLGIVFAIIQQYVSGQFASADIWQAFIQGIIAAWCSTGVNQVIKQIRKKE